MTSKQPVVPAYLFDDEGARRFAYRCPFCNRPGAHGDTGSIFEWRGNESCAPNCHLYGGVSFFIVGEIASIDALPTLPANRAAGIIEALTNGVSK